MSPPRDIHHVGFERRHPRLTVVFEAAAAAAVAPLITLLRARVIRFATGGQLLSVIPGGAGVVLRRAWYRATLATCGVRLRIGFGTVIRDPMTRFGDDCVVVDHVRIARALCGSDVVIADYATLQGRARRHDRRDIPLRDQLGDEPTTLRIGDDVWIGAGARVLADVAAHSVVGAGAVVVSTFPEWCILGGVPARVIGERAGGYA